MTILWLVLAEQVHNKLEGFSLRIKELLPRTGSLLLKKQKAFCEDRWVLTFKKFQVLQLWIFWSFVFQSFIFSGMLHFQWQTSLKICIVGATQVHWLISDWILIFPNHMQYLCRYHLSALTHLGMDIPIPQCNIYLDTTMNYLQCFSEHTCTQSLTKYTELHYIVSVLVGSCK